MRGYDFSQLLESADGHAALPPQAILEFRRVMYDFYEEQGREFPWRETRDPYEILVSELMLQQTQTVRVTEKYEPFLRRFPDFQTLARAGLQEVYGLWRGLGYNRRAKALRDIAARVVEEYSGKLPAEPELLETFPGIGPYTARAICAFAFEAPVVFIETNIRRLFIHLFFPNREEAVHDREILPLVEATLDRADPRRWYYALMDYGAWVRRNVPNPNARSVHYTRQAPFANSNRQIRGRILGLLADRRTMASAAIISVLEYSDERIYRSLIELEEDGLVVCENGIYRIAN